MYGEHQNVEERVHIELDEDFETDLFFRNIIYKKMQTTTHQL